MKRLLIKRYQNVQLLKNGYNGKKKKKKRNQWEEGGSYLHITEMSTHQRVQYLTEIRYTSQVNRAVGNFEVKSAPRNCNVMLINMELSLAIHKPLEHSLEHI